MWLLSFSSGGKCILVSFLSVNHNALVSICENAVNSDTGIHWCPSQLSYQRVRTNIWNNSNEGTAFISGANQKGTGFFPTRPMSHRGSAYGALPDKCAGYMVCSMTSLQNITPLNPAKQVSKVFQKCLHELYRQHDAIKVWGGWVMCYQSVQVALSMCMCASVCARVCVPMVGDCRSRGSNEPTRCDGWQRAVTVSRSTTVWEHTVQVCER